MSRDGLRRPSSQKLNVLKATNPVHYTFTVRVARENVRVVSVPGREGFVSLGEESLIMVIASLVKLFRALCHTVLHF